MTTLEEQALWQDGEEGLDEEVLRMSTEELLGRTRLGLGEGLRMEGSG